jgi:BirA family biotin operon repressor/biotin-[acetyl-CoA-carboxylase] ligase
VVKWVNDVQVRGKKIAGILAETESSPACGEEYILLGIGINVNNDSFPTELASTATSLCAETGAPVDVDLLTARLLAKLAWYIGLLSFEEQQALEQNGLRAAAVLNNGLVLDLWRRLSDTAGRRVLFGYDVRKIPLFEAIAEGVNADGALLLRLDDGTTVVENSGEIIYID